MAEKTLEMIHYTHSICQSVNYSCGTIGIAKNCVRKSLQQFVYKQSGCDNSAHWALSDNTFQTRNHQFFNVFLDNQLIFNHHVTTVTTVVFAVLSIPNLGTK